MTELCHLNLLVVSRKVSFTELVDREDATKILDI